MSPRELIEEWVRAFNKGDAEQIAGFYAPDAVNHQVVQEPIQGREAIKEFFARELATAQMTCIIENIFEDGNWAILEWKDPLGLRGCGFFRIENDLIVFQRGYWDRLSFLRQHNLPVPQE